MKQIEIYKHEIDYINNLKVSENAKRTLLTLLVKSKFEIKNLLIEKKVRDSVHATYKKQNKIFEYTNLTKGKFFEFMRELFKCSALDYDDEGYIIFNPPECEDESEVALTVTNHMKAGLYFDYYNYPSKVKLCKECEQPFRAGNNSQKYCSDNCKDEVIKRQKREWDRENR